MKHVSTDVNARYSHTTFRRVVVIYLVVYLGSLDGPKEGEQDLALTKLISMIDGSGNMKN